MTDKKNTPTADEKLAEQQKQEIIKEFKDLSKAIGQSVLRTVTRTGTVYVLGRKFAPETFSSFGRAYAFVLLIDMLKTKRYLPPVKPETTVNVTNAPEPVKTNSTTFRHVPPDTRKGHVKGDRWYVLGVSYPEKIIGTYLFDGTKWVKLDISSAKI